MMSPMEKSARDRIAEAPPSAVYTLDERKAARLKGRTMLIPSPQAVRAAIAAIAPGSCVSADALRATLARDAGAEVTCPRAFTLAWLLVAEASDEARAVGEADATPWWRVTRDHAPEPRLPGGTARHRALLASEGVALSGRGGAGSPRRRPARGPGDSPAPERERS